MSYVNLICPSCKNKHEVSNFYLKSNNLISSEELALNLCGCSNFKSTFDESVVENYPNSIFTEKFQSQFKRRKNRVSDITINYVYNYIPEKTLEFKYLEQFDRSVKQAEIHFSNKWNKKELLLKHKCQQNLRTSNYWTDTFNYIKNYTVDHDNSYLVLRALKKRDQAYIKFLSKRLNNILKDKELTICRIPSSISNTENGCDDVIRELVSLNSNYKDGRKCINRNVTIPKIHITGQRNIDQHLSSSEIKNHELLNNKDVLLIDDIVTTGKSVEAFSQLIKHRTKPKSLTIFVFSGTVKYENRI